MMKKILSTMIICVVQALSASSALAFGPFTSAVLEVGGDDYTGYCYVKTADNSTSSCTYKNQFAITLGDNVGRGACEVAVAAFMAGKTVTIWGNDGVCLDSRQRVRIMRINN